MMTARALQTATLALILIFGSGNPGYGQTLPASGATRDLHELVLKDGSRFYGRIETETETHLRFETASGAVIEVPRPQIATIRRVRGEVRNGEFVRHDTHRSRLFFGPTARSLPAGTTSLGIFEIYMPFVQTGVTDRLSIGGGTPLVFGFDESERPFWLTPKLQVLAGDRRQAAVGLFHIFNVDGDGVGIVYGVTTFGSDDEALTIGGGLAYADGSRGAVLMVGAESRPRANLKLITENYVWSGGGILSAGVRFIGDRLSADVGLAVPVGVDFFIAVPVVNFVYVF